MNASATDAEAYAWDAKTDDNQTITQKSGMLTIPVTSSPVIVIAK